MEFYFATTKESLDKYNGNYFLKDGSFSFAGLSAGAVLDQINQFEAKKPLLICKAVMSPQSVLNCINGYIHGSHGEEPVSIIETMEIK